MRSLLIRILGTALSFFVTSYFIAGFQIEPTWQAYLLASVVFVILNAIVGPLVKLLLLPINLLTLGLLRWLSSVIVLYIFDLLYDGISISGYHYTGMTSGVLSLPPLEISLFWALVLSSFVISLTYSLFSSLFSGE